MAGFTIHCDNCGTEIKSIDDFKQITDKISFYVREGREYITVTIWCEKCDNNAEFETEK